MTVSMLLAVSAAAVTPAGALPPRDDRDLLELPAYLPDTAPPFALPPVPEMPADAPLSAGPRVFVRTIELTGVTVFNADELASVTAPYQNREITTEELQALRIALTRYYVDRGYINSGAVIPDQSVSDGRIEINIVEGRLSQLELDGNHSLSTAFYERRMNTEPAVPLNMNVLQEDLQILLQHPLVKQVNAELRPGEEPGQSVLSAHVVERPPYIVNADFDNALAPSLGGLRARLALGHRSLLGYGDTALLQYQRADGLERKEFSYQLPVTAHDTVLGAWIDSVESRNVEAPFNIIDIESKYDAHGISLAQPLLRTSAHSLTLTAAFDRRTSRTFLLGIPFSFAPGVQNGQSEVSVVRLSQDWLERTREHVLALRSVFNIGIDAFGPTSNRDAPDGRFFIWLGQAQYARLFTFGQVIVRTDVQVSADPLLPMEKLAIGGAATVRGYRENQLVRDQGFVASVEFRRPLYRGIVWPLALDAAIFADAGGAWDRAEPTPDPRVIGTLGVGLRGEAWGKLRFQLYWGHPLVAAEDPGGNLQDDGIHFAISGNLFE